MISNHEHYMSVALDEAKKGRGFVSPNPMVGAVIVRNGKIISSGYHRFCGGDHAEADAVKNAAGSDLRGAALYVSLEPCCHFGRTPPCTDLILKKGFGSVVISCIDADPRVAGKGAAILRNAGMKVTTGVLEKQARKLNYIYFHNKRYNRPYVLLKAAMTLDGKIATFLCRSKWMSSEKCRDVVQRLRLGFKAVAVGKNTVLEDGPRLNCRISGYEDKPLDRLVFSRTGDQGLLKGFEGHAGRNFIIDKNISNTPGDFIDFCIRHEIDSVLVEGGGEIYTWFLENGLVDCIYLFYKPAFMGNDGIPVFNGRGVGKIDELKDFHIIGTKKIDGNLLVKLKKEETCLPE